MIAGKLGLSAARLSRSELFGAVDEVLHGRDEPSLWIVDDIPPGLPSVELHRMLLAAGDRVHTVFITGDAPVSGDLPAFRLNELSAHDSRLLLTSYREAQGEAESAALDEISPILGGHPQAVELVGRRLDRECGSIGYVELARELRAGPDAGKIVDGRIRAAVRDLDLASQWTLALAGVCGPGYVLTQALRALAQRYGQVSEEALRRALPQLVDRQVVERIDSSWRVRPIVIIAARDCLRLGIPQEELILAVGSSLAAFAPPDAQQRLQLCEQAAVLIEQDLPDTISVRLLGLLAADADSRGDAPGAPYAIDTGSSAIRVPPMLWSPQRTRAIGQPITTPARELAVEAVAATTDSRCATGPSGCRLRHPKPRPVRRGDRVARSDLPRHRSGDPRPGRPAHGRAAPDTPRTGPNPADDQPAAPGSRNSSGRRGRVPAAEAARAPPGGRRLNRCWPRRF